MRDKPVLSRFQCDNELLIIRTSMHIKSVFVYDLNVIPRTQYSSRKGLFTKSSDLDLSVCE